MNGNTDSPRQTAGQLAAPSDRGRRDDTHGSTPGRSPRRKDDPAIFGLVAIPAGKARDELALLGLVDPSEADSVAERMSW